MLAKNRLKFIEIQRLAKLGLLALFSLCAFCDLNAWDTNSEFVLSKNTMIKTYVDGKKALHIFYFEQPSLSFVREADSNRAVLVKPVVASPFLLKPDTWQFYPASHGPSGFLFYDCQANSFQSNPDENRKTYKQENNDESIHVAIGYSGKARIYLWQISVDDSGKMAYDLMMPKSQQYYEFMKKFYEAEVMKSCRLDEKANSVSIKLLKQKEESLHTELGDPRLDLLANPYAKWQTANEKLLNREKKYLNDIAYFYSNENQVLRESKEFSDKHILYFQESSGSLISVLTKPIEINAALKQGVERYLEENRLAILNAEKNYAKARNKMVATLASPIIFSTIMFFSAGIAEVSRDTTDIAIMVSGLTLSLSLPFRVHSIIKTLREKNKLESLQAYRKSLSVGK